MLRSAQVLGGIIAVSGPGNGGRGAWIAGLFQKHGGYEMHAVLTITELLDYWEQTGRVEKDKIKETREFLSQQ